MPLKPGYYKTPMPNEKLMSKHMSSVFPKKAKKPNAKGKK